MSLEKLSDNKEISPYKTSREEIRKLLSGADDDIKQAESGDITPRWKLEMAHNAVLQCASAALRASGYRARAKDYHKIVISTMQFTIGIPKDEVRVFDGFRRKRNTGKYEDPDCVTAAEADELISLARGLTDKLLDWFGSKHPDLVGASE